MTEQDNVYPDSEDTAQVEDLSTADNPQEALDSAEESNNKPTMVPLAAVQKERRRAQKYREELDYYKSQHGEDESRYESATKEDLGKSKQELKREITEELWIQQNPEKFKRIEAELDNFLETRPTSTEAIRKAKNRYQEAWEHMQAFSPRKPVTTEQPRAKAPGSPSSVPKSAALNEAVDVMKMTDAEFNEWRASKRRK